MRYQRDIKNWDDVPVVMDLPMASRIVRQTPESLQQRAIKGEFPAYKEGGQWRVEKEKLRRYMDERCVMDEYKQPKEPDTSVFIDLLTKAIEAINNQKKEAI